MPNNIAVKLFDDRTTTGAGDVHPVNRSKNLTFQIIGQTSAGSGTVDVALEASLDGTNFFSLTTAAITALSTTPSSGDTAVANVVRFVRGNVTTIGGTGASVDVWMCMENLNHM